MAQKQVPAPIQSNRCRDLFQVNQTITLSKLSSFQAGRRLFLREKHVADRHAHQYDTSDDGHDDAGVLPGKAVLGHVLDQDARISPDDHQSVGDVMVADHRDGSDHKPDYDDQDCPDRLRNSEAIPADVDQQRRDVRNRRHRDPAEIDAERKADEHFFLLIEFFLQDQLVDVDQAKQDHQHQDHRQADHAVMPTEDPSGVDY